MHIFLEYIDVVIIIIIIVVDVVFIITRTLNVWLRISCLLTFGMGIYNPIRGSFWRHKKI